MSLSIYQKGLLIILVPFAINLLWLGLFWQSLQHSSAWLETNMMEGRQILLLSRGIALFDKLTINACGWVRSSGDKAIRDQIEKDGLALLRVLDELKNATKSDSGTSAITEKISRNVASFESDVRAISLEPNPLQVDYMKRLPSARFMGLMKDTTLLMDSMKSRDEKFNDTLEKEDRDRYRTKLIAIGGLILNLVIAVALAWFLQRNIAGRIAKIALKAHNLSNESYALEKLEGEDELSELDRELLTARQQLQEEYRHRKYFTAMMAKKLQTSLQACIKSSLQLQQQEPAMSEPGCAKNLSSLRSSVTSCLSLIEDMLLLDRLESGTLPVDIRASELRLLASSAIGLVDSLALNKKITIQNQIDDITVPIDQARIKQVLVNLLSNAIKFSPAGGVVSLESEMQGSRLRISVTDAGPGIEKQARARLFQKFYQAADGKAAGGTGLGLAIAKLIVDSHNGLIGVDSTHGHGSTFWFEIPIS